MQALMGSLSVAHLIPSRCSVAVIKALCGVDISAGTVSNDITSYVHHVQPVDASLHELARGASVTPSDEIGVRIKGSLVGDHVGTTDSFCCDWRGQSVVLSWPIVLGHRS